MFKKLQKAHIALEGELAAAVWVAPIPLGGPAPILTRLSEASIYIPRGSRPAIDHPPHPSLQSFHLPSASPVSRFFHLPCVIFTF